VSCGFGGRVENLETASECGFSAPRAGPRMRKVAVEFGAVADGHPEVTDT
jgi:hypothetical protein